MSLDTDNDVLETSGGMNTNGGVLPAGAADLRIFGNGDCGRFRDWTTIKHLSLNVSGQDDVGEGIFNRHVGQEDAKQKAPGRSEEGTLRSQL